MSKSKYDTEFKKIIVSLYQNGKSRSYLSIEYGVSLSLIAKWIKRFSEVKKFSYIAFNKYNKPKNIIFHSDSVSQYTSKKFRDLLDSLNVVQSFSKCGYPYDNAAL